MLLCYGLSMADEMVNRWEWCFLPPEHLRLLALMTAGLTLFVLLSGVVAALRLLRASGAAGGRTNRYLHLAAILSAGTWLVAAAYERFVVTARILRLSRATNPGDYSYIEDILNHEFALGAGAAAGVIALSLLSLWLWRRLARRLSP